MLGQLPLAAGVPTRQISAENPTGEKGGACKWDPNPADPNLVHSGPSLALGLGRGWKVRPFITIKAGRTETLADIQGPGCINEIFLTSDVPAYRAMVLRIYWDEEPTPSVEVPMGDFFAMGHDAAPHLVNSLPVVVGPHRACSSYWQMPFRGRARITLANESDTDARIVAYRVLYKRHPVPETAAYFHAQWRQSTTRVEHPEHVIVDGVRGCGVYVGTYIAWTAKTPGWWGEGEVKFYLDGDGEFPTMADNGTEDYFGGAWGFMDRAGENTVVFSTPFLGLPVARVELQPRLFGMYRWHVLDSIGFQEDLRATIQALAWTNGRYVPLADDVASVAYWYQSEPHAAFPAMPGVGERVKIVNR
jgi:hypothetical protein